LSSLCEAKNATLDRFYRKNGVDPSREAFPAKEAIEWIRETILVSGVDLH